MTDVTGAGDEDVGGLEGGGEVGEPCEGDEGAGVGGCGVGSFFGFGVCFRFGLCAGFDLTLVLKCDFSECDALGAALGAASDIRAAGLKSVPVRYAPTAKVMRTAAAIPSFGVKIVRQIFLPIDIFALNLPDAARPALLALRARRRVFSGARRPCRAGRALLSRLAGVYSESNYLPGRKDYAAYRYGDAF